MSRRKPAPPPAADFAPGHFMRSVHAHDWPPGFEPRYQRTNEVELSAIAREKRERRVAAGDPGTIVGLSDRSEALQRQRMAPIPTRGRRAT